MENFSQWAEGSAPAAAADDRGETLSLSPPPTALRSKEEELSAGALPQQLETLVREAVRTYPAVLFWPPAVCSTSVLFSFVCVRLRVS